MRLKLVVAGVLTAPAVAGGTWMLRPRPVEAPTARVGRDLPVRVFGLGTI